MTALALVGLFNIVGTYSDRLAGRACRGKYILSAIYFGRSIVIALFFWLPISPCRSTRSPFALGLLWLSTVPTTNSIVAQIFGVRYLAMLSGFTFFSHQIGSFLGAWLGGRLYDRPAATTSSGGSRSHSGIAARAHQSADRRARDQAAGHWAA